MSDFLSNLPSDPEPLAIERDLTIRDVQQQMEANLKRWYPFDDRMTLIRKCGKKTSEEYREWYAIRVENDDREECADIVIALSSYCAMRGIDLQSEIERKLAIVSARTDQAERDKARGIG